MGQCQSQTPISSTFSQGGDLAAGTQALPVGKIIDDKVCRKDNQKGIANLHMRQFLEPQQFFAAAWQNRDLRSSKAGPRQTLFKHFLSYFQNIGVVEPGFEASKFLHKSEPHLWSIVNCRKFAIYDWPLQTATFIFVCYQTNIWKYIWEFVWIKFV